MFDWSMLTRDDYDIMGETLGCWRVPDLIIAPNDTPYIYRWHVIPKNNLANVYLHVQTSSDPWRPLHDHPWQNTSVILSGGYKETFVDPTQPWWRERDRYLLKGDFATRPASIAHRLELPKHFKYVISLFTTGPKIRQWGFWPDGKFVPQTEFVELTDDGRSVTKQEHRND